MAETMECHICLQPAEETCPRCKLPVCVQHIGHPVKEIGKEYDTPEEQIDPQREYPYFIKISEPKEGTEHDKLMAFMEQSNSENVDKESLACPICASFEPGTYEWVEAKKFESERFVQQCQLQRALFKYSLDAPEVRSAVASLIKRLIGFITLLNKDPDERIPDDDPAAFMNDPSWKIQEDCDIGIGILFDLERLTKATNKTFTWYATHQSLGDGKLESLFKSLLAK